MSSLRKQSRTYSIVRWVAVILVMATVTAILLWMRYGFAGREQSLPTNPKRWQAYEGAWVSEQNTISNLRNGRGDKLISSLRVPDDLAYSAEMRFDSESDMQWGDAGIVMRVTAPASGTDAFHGYYLGLRPISRELLLGRVDVDYVNLALEPLKEPLELGAWYRLELRANGCHLQATAWNNRMEKIGSAVVEDHGCQNVTGSAGLRSYSMLASWKNLRISRLH